jgi:hypothetical protein
MSTGPNLGLDPALGERPHLTGHEGVSYRTTLLLASLAAIFLWYWPVGRIALSPITFINTYIHEYCHALVALLTGGQVKDIMIFQNAGGVTQVLGGNQALVASAGYMGSAIVGAFFMWLAQKEKLVRGLLVFGAMVLAVGMIWLVRGEAFPVTIGIVSVVVLLAAAKFLPIAGAVFVGQFLAIQQCAASFQAFYWLFSADPSQGVSDAQAMGNLTHMPAVFWASVWSAFSALLVFFAVRAAWRDGGRARQRRTPRTGAESF